MKLRTLMGLSLLVLSSTLTLAHPDKRKEKGRDPKVERTIAADANVAVSVCVVSGSIRVRGWDRNEVRARSSEAAEIEFRRVGEGADTSAARKLDVLIADEGQGVGHARSCESFSELQLDLPRGATVQLKTRDSDIDVADVATVYVNTQNGDIRIERATRAVDAGTIGGDISLKNSSGGINLHSVGGNIDASSVRPVQAADIFEARSVGGDISLAGISHGQVKARTLNGSLDSNGPLTKGGRYELQTNSGDLTLTLPDDSSFKLIARFSQSADIISEFPLTLSSLGSTQAMPSPPTPAPPVGPTPKADAAAKPGAAPRASPVPKIEPVPAPAPDDDNSPVVKVKTDKYGRNVVVTLFAMRRIEGIHGSGDATVELSSFSGTIHLRKQ